MQETLVWSLGWEDPLKKAMATHSSILAWEMPWTEEPGRMHFMGLQRVRHDWATNTFTHTYIYYVLYLYTHICMYYIYICTCVLYLQMYIYVYIINTYIHFVKENEKKPPFQHPMTTGLGRGGARASPPGQGAGAEGRHWYCGLWRRGASAPGPEAASPARTQESSLIRVKLEKEFWAWIFLFWVSAEGKSSFSSSQLFPTEPTHNDEAKRCGEEGGSLSTSSR